ncbi:ROK family protein [Amycolatopsis sp. A133]|uniref:ROK family transcriptional regulator n=1 Tax=Amycolatopsis sp. A133 TaxID=3064472 RepID=UPI0027F4D6AE|nr:ROK family protein [Amycolatopsis sp. A133]MDQ7809022.1 ROK family protein [Amycolatopsis sp. A133]
MRNRRAVLSAARFGRPVTRLEIARTTGLSAATVSGLVADLIADGVLVELERRVPPAGVAGGRPAAALAVNPALGVLIGVHLAHAGIRILLAGVDGTVRAEHTHDIDVDHRPADTLEYVASTALDLVADLGIPHRELLGVGVAVSAPVLLHSQTLGSPPMLNDWGEVDIATRLRKRMGLPVHLGNDADLGALAEWRLGAAASVDNLVYVMLSEGVGAGLVLQGRLYDGDAGAAGELGHVTVVPDGQICRCGSRGCLETVVGARALATTLAHSHGPACGFIDLITLAHRGDPGVRRLLGDAGRAVGTALAPVCTVLNPKLVVVGGTLAQAGEPLLSGIRETLGRGVSPVTNRTPEVLPGALGTGAEALGAVITANQFADLS